MKDYMDRRVTSPAKRFTSPTWGPPPPCKKALFLFVVSVFSRIFIQGHARIAQTLLLVARENSRRDISQLQHCEETNNG